MKTKTGKDKNESYKLCKWIDKAKNFQPYKNWIDDCQAAWAEYLNTEIKSLIDVDTISKRVKTKMPLFWASIQNLTPAYYARTPETVARRMFDDDDPVARTAVILYERLSKSRLERYPIDAAMSAAVLDFLLCDKGTVRIFLEEEKATQITDVPVVMTDDGLIIRADTGEQVEGEVQDIGGQMIATITEEITIAVHTELQPVGYDEILHDPHAKHWHEIERMAFKLCLTKEDFKKRFGKEWLEKVKVGKDSDEKEDDNKDKQDDVYQVWEVWDKPSKKVYYVSLNYKDEVLLELEDPYQLKDFFPVAPFVIATKHPKYLLGVPLYVQLKDVIVQLHTLFARMKRLVSGLRRRGIADASLQPLIDAIKNNDDAEIVATDKFQQLVDKKALGDLIYWIPLQELSQAVVEARQLIEEYKQMFFELSGVPDVVRGVTEAQETAASQQMKGNFYNVRTSWNQHQVQDMARWAVQAQCDLALARLSEDKILEETCAQSLPPENQEFLMPAVQLLKDTNQRTIKLDIETDSLTLMYQDNMRAERNLVVETIMNGLNQVQQIGQTSPALMPMAFEMLLFSVRGVDLGKEYEAGLAVTARKLQEMMDNPPEPPPPPPDYEGMKIQIQQQKAMIDQQKMEMDGVIRMRELDQKEVKLSVDTQLDQLKGQIEQAYLLLDQQKQHFDQAIEAQRVEIETYLGMLKEREKLIEEARLNAQLQARIDGDTGTRQAQAVPQNVIINNVPNPQPPEPEILPVPVPVEPEIF